MRRSIASYALLVVLLQPSATHAELTPMLPGWSAHTIAADLPSMYPRSLAVDPVSGDAFLAVLDPAMPGGAHLIRVHPNGSVTDLGYSLSYTSGLEFDALHRVLYVAREYGIDRLSETGALLATLPVPNLVHSPIVLGPDLRLYSLGLDLVTGNPEVVVFDELLGAWTHWRSVDVPYSVSDGLGLYLAFDGDGRLFLGGSGVRRVDATSTTLLRTYFIAFDLAAGQGLLLHGPDLGDPSADMQTFVQFTTWSLDGDFPYAIAVRGSGSVYFCNNQGFGHPTSLVEFSQGAVPTRRSTWSALKSLYH